MKGHRSVSLLVFLFLLSMYLLTYGRTILSGDGWAMFATAENIARQGKLDMDQLLWMGLQQGTPGRDGHLYSRKGLGVPLLALPLVWLGLKVPGFGVVKTALLFNAIVIAGWGMMAHRLMRELGYGEDAALAIALLLGLTTPAWAYAKTFFSEPLIGLGLLGCVYFLVRFERSRRQRELFAAGVMYALSILAKAVYMVFLPLVIILAVGKRERGDTPRTPRPDDVFRGDTPCLPQLGGLLAFLGPHVLSVLLILAYNYLRYGNPFTTGYLPEESFSAVWWQGILGLTVSPGKGLIWYTPVLLVLPWAWPAFHRRHKSLSLFIATFTIANVLLFGKWFMWHGGHAWGPRFLVPLLPLLVIPLAEGWHAPRIRKVLLMLGIAGLLVQIPGVSVPFGLHQERLQAQGLPLYAPETFFTPRYSPLFGVWRFLRVENLNFAWMVGGKVDALALALSATLCASMAWLLFKRQVARARLRVYLSAPSAFSAAILAVILLLARYDARDTPSPLRDVLGFIARREKPGQAIINPMLEWSGYVSDAYKGHLPVYGLRDGHIDPPPETARWLGRLIKRYDALWLLQCPFPPELSGIERPLMAFGFRVLDADFNGTRLAMYAFPKGGLRQRDVNVAFGGVMVLESYAYSSQVEADGMVLAELKWQALATPDRDYLISLALVDESGQEVLRRDEAPVLWTRPTTTWQPGEEITDRHGFLLLETIAPGVYELVLRVYEPESGETLEMIKGDTEFKLGKVRVVLTQSGSGGACLPP